MSVQQINDSERYIEKFLLLNTVNMGLDICPYIIYGRRIELDRSLVHRIKRLDPACEASSVPEDDSEEDVESILEQWLADNHPNLLIIASNAYRSLDSDFYLIFKLKSREYDAKLTGVEFIDEINSVNVEEFQLVNCFLTLKIVNLRSPQYMIVCSSIELRLKNILP